MAGTKDCAPADAPGRKEGRHRRIGPGAVVLASALVLAAAFLDGPSSLEAAARDDTATLVGTLDARSQAGAYLAGTFAAAEDDQAAAADFLIQALQSDRDNLILQRRAFIAALGGGLIDEGVALAEDILDSNDSSGDVARLVLAVGDLAGGRYEEALTGLATVDRSGIARFSVPMLEAWALAGSGALEEALATLDPVAAHDGFAPLIDLHRALIRDVVGDGDTASAYEQALTHGDSPRLIAAAGNYYERQGAPDEARALYDRFLIANPDSLLFEPALARLDDGTVPRALLSSAKHGAAEVLFQIASVISRDNAVQTALIYTNLARHLRPDFPSAAMLLGDILSDRGHDDQALGVYRSISDEPAVGWGARLRTAQMLARLERDEEAVALLQAMSADRPERSAPLVQLGDVHRFRGDFAAAIDAYDAAYATEPAPLGEDWSFLYRRGMALERERVFNRAIDDLQRAIDLNEEHAHLLNYLGYLWIDLGENLEEGEALVRRALELRPNDGYIIDSLGWAYYRQGRFEEAVETLERAIRFRPLDPVINDHLGDAYWQVGRRNEARFQWSHALVGAEDADLIAGIEAKLTDGLGSDGGGQAATAGIAGPRDAAGTDDAPATGRP